MDAVVTPAIPSSAPSLARRAGSAAEQWAAMPPEAPLAMPTQSLNGWARPKRPPTSWRVGGGTWLARFIVFVGMLALTLYGAWQMYKVVEVGGVTVLEWPLLALFVVNFSWIAMTFTAALVGFVKVLRAPGNPPPLPEVLCSRTAILMPIYNEAPERVMAAIAAIAQAVETTGHGGAFEYFFLSDTTDPNIWVAEERAFLNLRALLGTTDRIWYRHRAENTGRKAGNIADWVTRWGGAYDHMLVLDADSLMTGEAIVHLAAAMERDPEAGIIQTLPLIINRNTLFARVQQFAASVYGPVLAWGLAGWMGKDGNYWGHNAIIRTKAFAAHAGLPELSGKPPFGGHILSHDFVEAALIRRAGYAVYMLPDLAGSYEESPPSLIDLAARDRRWCQGNMQHMRVIGANGLHLATRQHLATGILSYLASPLWLLQLLVGIALVLQAYYIRPEYFPDDFTLFPAWPRFDAERALTLFGVTMGVLLAPKFLGLLAAVLRKKKRQGIGSLRLMLSALTEIVLSALLAPIMMLIQSGSVFEILLGRDSGWTPQRRDDGTIPLSQIVRRHRWHTLLGLAAGLSAYVVSPYLFFWMSPTILGLVLAVPLSWGTSQLGVGLWFKRWGLLATPEENGPPDIVRRANDFQQALRDEARKDALRLIHGDPDLRAHHLAMLPARSSARGEFDPDLVMAKAKVMEAASLEEAAHWLSFKETFVALHDPDLVERIARLPSQPLLGYTT